VASIIKDKARVFNANQFLNLFSTGSENTWQSGAIYSTNDIAINNNREYVATSSGTAGGTPPTHTTGNVSDGGVTWQHVRPALVTNFYKNNLFMSLGKTEPWDDEQAPPQAMNYTELDYTDLADSLFFKRLGSANASMGIKRNQWVSGSIYDSYVTDVELDTMSYYVTNNSNRIYICIDNNGNNPSTSEPTDINTTFSSFKTGDGYTWKYMGEISDLNFMSTDYVPVVRVLSDNGSHQWEIQQNSKPNSLLSVNINQAGAIYTDGIPTINIVGSAVAVASLLAGSLDEITLSDVGTDYTVSPYCAVIPQVGTDRDNHQPNINVITAGGAVTGFNILNGGQYNTANTITATILANTGGSGCSIEPVFSGFTLTGFTITSIDGGTNYTDADTISLDDGAGNIESHDVILNANVGTSSGLGSNILEDCNAKYIILNDNIVGDEAGYIEEDIDFRQVLLVVDPVDEDGGDAGALRYFGPAGAGYAGATNNQKIKAGTGSLIYVDNIEAIQRTANQQENIKIILKF